MQVLSSLNSVNLLQNKYVNQAFDASKTAHRAVFSNTVHPSLSDKYVPIPTYRVLDTLISHDLVDFEWEVLKQDKSRKQFGETKAIIVAVYFKLEGFDGKFALYIINSANGTKKMRVAFGFLNGACLNGCIWGEILRELTQKHYGENARNIQTELDQLVATLKTFIGSEELRRELGVIKTMKSIQVTQAQKEEIAQKAFALRLKYSATGGLVYGDTPTAQIGDLEIKPIIVSHREAFAQPSLWNLYQTVHENLGGNFNHAERKTEKVKFTLITNDETGKEVVKNRSIRNSTNIDDKVKFNIELMDLMKTLLPSEQVAA